MLEVSLGGLESFWFAALVLAALVAGAYGRLVLAFALVGLATLTRPEGVLYAAALGGVIPWRRPRVMLRCGLIYATVLLLWGIPATLYYGSPIPHSLVAKSQPLYPLAAGTALREIAMLLRSWLVGAWPPSLSWLQSGLALLLLVSAGVGFWAGWRRGQRRPILALLPFSICVAFYSLSNPMIFPWYWPNLYVPLLLLLAVGLGLLWRYADAVESPSRLRMRGGLGARLLVAMGVLLAVFPVSRWELLRAAHAQTAAESAGLRFIAPDRRASVVRVLPYWILGRWLSERYPASTVAAAPEIGAFGYAFHGKVLDVCGLVSPEAIPYLPVSAAERVAPYTGAIATQLVLDLQPDLVVSMQLFKSKSLHLSKAFENQYQLVAECALPHRLWLSHSIEVFERRTGVVRLTVNSPSVTPPPLKVLDPTL